MGEEERKYSNNELKSRLSSEEVLMPYKTELDRLYIESSPVGTQATLAQLHTTDSSEQAWRPVNHTSRAWNMLNLDIPGLKGEKWNPDRYENKQNVYTGI